MVAVRAQDLPGPDAYVADTEPPAFADPAKAVEAVRKALADNDLAGLSAILGLDPAMVAKDPGTIEAFEQIRAGAARTLTATGDGDQRTVLVGTRLWPLPFPLKKFEDGWAFDTFAGIEEIIDRRIGENELHTIETLEAIVIAQQDYADADRDGDGVLEFAQTLVSAEGQANGLYWPANDVDGESPAGSFVSDAELARAAAGRGYFGYRYRVLTAQGDNIAGGAHDFIVNGNMISGHAVVAWPAVYGQTGIHTFLVSHHGIVYEADLGDGTMAAVEQLSAFNPGDDWDVVAD
jgi:hypothetical protein